MIRLSLSVAALLSVLTACGGGGEGGGSTATFTLSAGADREAPASSRVSIVATAAPSVASMTWSQVDGPPISLASAPGATPPGSEVVFVAPDITGVVELEARASGSDGEIVGTDRVQVFVEAVRSQVLGTDLASISVRGGGAGRALASAYHGATARLFVVDGVAGDVACYDLSDPSAPELVGSVLPPAEAIGFQPGEALCVAAGETGPVAITYNGETSEYPGRLQLIDPATLQELRAVSTVGAHPVDVTMAPDGSALAIACAADAPVVGGGDGRGYVTYVRIPASGAHTLDPHLDVDPIPFSVLDGSEPALAQAGVRFFRGNPTASVDLTPRSVAFDPETGKAWAACPENDAIILLDLLDRRVTACRPLADRAWGTFEAGVETSALRVMLKGLPTLAELPGGSLTFGGISGVVDAALMPDGRISLDVVTGAGPTLAPVGSGAGATLPFVAPAAGLRVDRLMVGLQGGDTELGAGRDLRSVGGTLVTGRPAEFLTSPGLAGHDERATDLDGTPQSPDFLGARFAGGTVGPGDEVWLADARRAGLWRFDAAGELIQRYIPEGSALALGAGRFPPSYRSRICNLDGAAGRRFGGFGGVAYDPERDSVFGVLRLPLDNPDTSADSTGRGSRFVRLVELDPANGLMRGEYVVVLDAVAHAAEGLAAVDAAPFDGRLALLESALDPAGARIVAALDLEGATNLVQLSPGDRSAVDAALESAAPGALGDLAVPVIPVRKTRIADLTDAGLGGGGRPSGVAAFGEGLVVTFDDGWGLENAVLSPGAGEIQSQAAPDSSIAVLVFSPTGVDGSNSGGYVPDAVPVLGMPQPLDLALVMDDGQPLVAAAQGGLPRVLASPGGPPPFDERARVGDLTLDTLVFPNAAVIQMPAVIGDLEVSTLGADANGDMQVERLYAFGSRSVAMFDADGAREWRSGGGLVLRSLASSPERVLGAASSRGIAPRAVAVGEVSAAPGGAAGQVLLTALGGAGIVVAHDLASPRSPRFAGVVADVESPADLDLGQNGGTLLFVTDEVRGRVEVLRLRRH